MSGSSKGGAYAQGVFGQLGIPASTNTPGAGTGTISWKDPVGNFWLFGGGLEWGVGSVYIDDVWEYNQSAQEWIWMAGSSSECFLCVVAPVFGSYQTPAAGNTPGGGISPAATWTDEDGNLWLFGGHDLTWAPNGNGGYEGIYQPVNAVWEFNVSTLQWVWMAGSSNVNGVSPGVYGALGQAAPGNTPGGRTGSASWIDSGGNFWVFGGYGEDSAGNQGYLNDLWMFDPATDEWTWMSGSNTTFSGACLNVFEACSEPAVSGTLQTFAAGNTPVGRSGASVWTGARGNFWLFGGTTAVSYDINGSSGFESAYVNDLWEFNPTTLEWAWMGGTATLSGNAPQYANTPGVYGTLGTPSASNTPGGRAGSYTWTDSSGNLWLFAGTGFSSTITVGGLNDLWMFNPGENEWAWMRGSNTLVPGCETGSTTCSRAGIYGSLGTPAASNTPGFRGLAAGSAALSAAQWTDQSGNIWLFGGWGVDSVGTWGELNDLWEFDPATHLWTWMGGSNTVPNNGTNSDGQAGVYGTLGVQAATNWPGGRSVGPSWTDNIGNFWLFGGIGCDSAYCGDLLNDLWVYGPTAPQITPSYFLSSTPNQVPIGIAPGTGETWFVYSTITSTPSGGFNSDVSLSASGQPAGVSVSFNPIWITGGAGTSTMTINVDSSVPFGTYPITVTGTSGSSSEATTVTLSVSSVYTAATPTFNPPAGTYSSGQSVTISDTTPGAAIYYSTNGASPTTSSSIYSGPITMSSSGTIEAMAVASGYTNSSVVSATYTINTATCVSAALISQPSNKMSEAKLIAAQKEFDLLPLRFEPNRGQSSSDAKFLVQGRGFYASFRENETDFQFTNHAAKSGLLRVTLLNASGNTALSGEQRLPGTVNYFNGDDPEKWHTGLPTFERLRYSSVYPGTDLVYYGNKGRLEFDFQLSPGAAPSSIQMRFDGARNLRIDANGDLIIAADGGQIAFRKPIIYQPAGPGRKDLVAGHFRVLKKNKVCFSVAEYDHARPLIIDPILNYSTYVGSLAYATAIAVDQNGEAYVTGVADVNFPTTPGSYQPVAIASTTADNMWPSVGKPFVAKFNSTGTALLYSTFLSGSGIDAATGIALDSKGDAFVVGNTSSTNFPISPGALQTTNNATQYSGFVTALNSTGSSLLYSTYVGGSTSTVINHVTVDGSGDAYFVGATPDANFPTTSGAFESAPPSKSANGSSSAFIAKLNPSGTALIYSTYLGGSGADSASSIAVDSTGEAYVGGNTASFDFPVTSGAFQGSRQASNQQAGFISKLNASGATLLYSTYLGGNYVDNLTAIAVDSNGDAYATGSTSSRFFPVTQGAFQTGIGIDSFGDPQQNAFVTELNSAGTSLVYSTFLGGSFSDFWAANVGDQADTIALDGQGMVYVAGIACTGEFPVTAGAFQSQNQDGENSGGCTGFFTKMNPAPNTPLLYSSYFGGTGNQDGTDYPEEDGVAGLALDSSANVYLAGTTHSVDFPTTAGVVETAFLGVTQEATVAEFNGSEMKSLPVPTVSLTSSTSSVLFGQPVTFTATVQCVGGVPPTGFIGFNYFEPETSDNPDPPNTTGIGFGPWTTVPLNSSGTASVTTTSLVALQSPVNAFYLGDANYAPATGTMTQTLTDGATTTTVTASANNVPYGTPVVFTATVLDSSGNPAKGFVDFVVGNLEYASLNLNGAGQATWTNGTGGPPLAVGTDTLNVDFYPYTGYSASSSNIAETFTSLGVTPSPTFNPPAGTYTSDQQVTLSDSNSAASIYYTTNGSMPVPGTSPQFLAGITIPVNGSETINAVAVATGNSASNVVAAAYTINLPVPTFSFVASPTSLTVNSGSQGSTTLTVTPQNGFSSTVSFACSGLPSNATCSFSPTTVTPSGVSATTQLTITVGTQANAVRPGSRPFLPATGLALAACLFVWKYRRVPGAALLVLVGFTLLSGCGGGVGAGGGGGGGSSPITSTVTITATSGSIQQTASVTLTVN